MPNQNNTLNSFLEELTNCPNCNLTIDPLYADYCEACQRDFCADCLIPYYDEADNHVLSFCANCRYGEK